MCFFEKEIAGSVLLPPQQSEVHPRGHRSISRSVPVTTIRLHATDNQLYNVNYSGEMEGPLSQDDYIVLRGFFRGPGLFRATQIWLRGHIDINGNLVEVNPPILIANKTVCVVATLLFGANSEELKDFLWFRDKILSRTCTGRAFISVYYYLAPCFVVQILDDSPFLQSILRFILKYIRILILEGRGNGFLR